jgi:uncharacterized iron-regulated membrane protein
MNGASRAARGSTAGRRRPVRWSAVALTIHNWLGLKLFLILAVVLLSGTLAVYRYEIDQLIYPELRVTPGPALASLDDIVAAVQRTYPEAGIAAEIPTGVGADDLAIGILGVFPDRGLRLIWVDPYRAVVQGDTPLMTLGGFLARLHINFFAQDLGLAIVCATAIVLAVSLITGLIAYRRFWRGFLRRPRFRTLRIAMVDLHKLVGLWSLWFLIVIALTGLWYFWVQVGEPMLGFPQAVERHSPPDLSEAEMQALGPATPVKVSLASALARARTQVPDFVSTYVSLPEHHGAPYVFHGNRGEALAINATTIAVDPYSGAITDVVLASEAPLINRIGWMVNPLHYGDFGGLLSKTIWFLFGLALSSLAITGVVIFWCRVTAPIAGAAGVLLRAFHPWRGAMGWLKPLNWAVLVLAAYAAVATAQFYASGTADAPVHLARQAVGPWTLGASLVAGIGKPEAPLMPGEPAVAIVAYCAGCWDQIRHLSVQFEGGDPYPVQGRPGFAFAFMVLPLEPERAQRLWLVAEGWDGHIHRSSWSLDLPPAE